LLVALCSQIYPRRNNFGQNAYVRAKPRGAAAKAVPSEGAGQEGGGIGTTSIVLIIVVALFAAIGVSVLVAVLVVGGEIAFLLNFLL